MYCCGVSESEHNRFTQFNLSALSKREKSFMFKPPAVFCSIRVVFLILADKVERHVFKGVFMTLQIKTSFESANVLIMFILPMMERSLWNHIFNVFFKDPNLSRLFFFSDTSRSYVKICFLKKKKVTTTLA